MSRYRRSSDDGSWCGCLLWIALIVFNVLVGGWSVEYLLEFFLNKAIPFLGAMVIGLFVGELSVPVAIVIAILKWCKVL